MKTYRLHLLCSVSIMLGSCHSARNMDSYKWTHTKHSSKFGDTKIDTLKHNTDNIYTHIDSPVMGVTHLFSDRNKTFCIISDGTGRDIIGSGITVYPNIKSSLDVLDLDLDGDIDFVMYGDQYFGRFKDNRFAPLLEADISSINKKKSVINYLNKNSSEQAAPRNR
jgi:hypothetical protein